MHEVSVCDLQLNPYTLFGHDLMALCVGSSASTGNARTITWGQIGTLWKRGSHAHRLPTATVYVRPVRHT